ncbi:MAG: dephospho-CoA kinase [Steroidobacteraceae bacterium]
MTFIVGLTGGVASGKSTVARLFTELGVPVFDTDQIARDVVEPGQPALDEVIACFGPRSLGPDGRLDRAWLRQQVFADPALRRRLEAILHPRIRAELARRSAAAGGAYQVWVIPLLVEGGGQDRVDRVLVVDCPADIQLQRLLKRDGSDPATARAMLEAQASREQRRAVADDLIDNTGSPAALQGAVEALHVRYLSLAGAREGLPSPTPASE